MSDLSPTLSDSSFRAPRRIRRLVIGAIAAVLVFCGGMITEDLLLKSGFYGDTTANSQTDSQFLPPTPTPTMSPEAMAAKIGELTNQERAKAGLKPLTRSALLDQSARSKVEDMLAKNYWAHTSPEGLTPWTFIDTVGYRYTLAGENLARKYATPEGIVSGWMESTSHRDNLLAAGYTQMGVFTKYIPSGEWLGFAVAMHFALAAP